VRGEEEEEEEEEDDDDEGGYGRVCHIGIVSYRRGKGRGDQSKKERRSLPLAFTRPWERGGRRCRSGQEGQSCPRKLCVLSYDQVYVVSLPFHQRSAT
jgi:hypothetical protein